MLCLTRKLDERVTIISPSGEICEIVLIEAKNKNARIGFDADQNWKFHRTEVLKKDTSSS